MSFDLTNKNIQDTFQNLLQQTGSTGEVYDLEGNRVTNVNINTISSSVITSSIVEIPNASNQGGNKLHARSGVLYFGDTNLETGGSGLSNMVEDTTPQLGGNLDVNSKDVNGDGNFLINGSGSFTQMNIGATSNTFEAFFNLNPSTTDKDLFLIQSGSFQSVKVNSSGVLNLGGFETEPTAITGGFYYNSDENEFYLGV